MTSICTWIRVGRRSGLGQTPVRDVVAGKVWNRQLGGYNAVANVGLDQYWLGHPLAMANLYGYGRLAWNPDLSAEQIAKEWTTLTFGTTRRLSDTVSRMLLGSWRMYEDYTGPLGTANIDRHHRATLRAGIESSEHNGWGQWHRADDEGRRHGSHGCDRHRLHRAIFARQWRGCIESLAKCPDDLLLFIHHVPYTYKLHSGKTVIQYIVVLTPPTGAEPKERTVWFINGSLCMG